MQLKTIVENIINRNRTIKGRVEYIVDYLEALNIQVKRHHYKHCENIECFFGNKDSSEEIIISAHHDISLKTNYGANDNTSSVALLLKLANWLRSNECKYNVRLLFNDNEELLGALNGSKITRELLCSIMPNVGSYLYLRDMPDRTRVKHIIILELCGIGDGIYIANKSGNTTCDQLLCDKLFSIGEKNKYNMVRVTIPSTDMISVGTFKMSATVVGAIPYYQACNYSSDNEKVPAVWKNIHSDKDNLFAINDKALQMCFTYLCDVLKQL